MNDELVIKDQVQALVDSGSSYLMLPQEDFESLRLAFEHDSGRSCWQ